MRTISDTVAVDLPDGYEAVVQPRTSPTRRGTRLPKGRVPLETPPRETNDLVDAMLGQDFELAADPVVLSAAPGATRTRKPARLDVTVEEDQDAVLLVEQDGVYSWREPVTRGEPERSARRTPRDRPVRQRTLTFEIRLAPEGAPATTRGWLTDLAFSKVRVFVLKYVARKVVGLAVRQLETHVRPGLRVVDGTNPTAWAPLSGSLELPAGRPPRVLLLVHGTFSSTVGGFGNLGGTTHGKKLLESFQDRYDVVLGYDHLTLSVDPAANAAELLSFLRSVDWPEPPVIDVVCHSRGALVTRALLEVALPLSGWGARIERVVYVGGVNAGTHLASPKNWKKLVDLYTNLAAAGARLLPDALASTVLSELVKGVGALVKLTVSYAVEDQGAPGLAAMDPDGPFVAELNRTPAGQPLPGTTAGYVIASEFEPGLSLKEPKTLPRQLLLAIGDLGADQLIGQRNDLVVDTASMAAIDTPPGTPSRFVQGVFEFDPDQQVFHTIYFHQRDTCEQIATWLGLRPTRRVVQGGRPRPPGPTPGGTVDLSGLLVELPARWDDLIEVGADRLHKVHREALATDAAPPRRGSRKGHDKPSRPVAPPAMKRAPARPTTRRTPPQGTVTAHLRASMAGQVVVDRRTTVRATLSREVLAAAAGISESGGFAPDPNRPITVQVVAKANLEVLGDDSADVAVPPAGAPVDLYFDIRPLAEGDGEVHVLARQGPVPMVTLVLRPEVVPATEAEGATRAAAIMSSAEGMPASVPESCVTQWLRITEVTVGDQTFYDFDLQAPDLGVLVRERSAALTGSRADYVEALYARIEERWVGSAGDSRQFMRELKALGGELFDELVPPGIGALLWKHRTRLRNVLLLSDEPFIPWELVHLKDRGKLTTKDWFLAQLGAIRWFQGSWPGNALSLDRVRVCAPDYPIADLRLEATAVEAAYLKDRLGATRVKPDGEAVLKVLSKPGSFDVFHFAGHGEAGAHEARILLEGRIQDGTYVVDELNETTLGEYADLAKEGRPRPIVVFNACQAGRQIPKLTRVGGFARSLVAKGAGVFVSSLWSVGDEPATEFTRALYDALLDGKTLAEASIAARDAAREGDESTWLAYVVYGNPCATVRSG